MVGGARFRSREPLKKGVVFLYTDVFDPSLMVVALLGQSAGINWEAFYADNYLYIAQNRLLLLATGCFIIYTESWLSFPVYLRVAGDGITSYNFPRGHFLP